MIVVESSIRSDLEDLERDVAGLRRHYVQSAEDLWSACKPGRAILTLNIILFFIETLFFYLLRLGRSAACYA